MSLDSRDTETALDLKIDPNNPVTYEQLSLRSYQKPLVKLLDIVDSSHPHLTIYNGGLFMQNNDLYLVARAEELDKEISIVKLYKYRSGKFYADHHVLAKNYQDPSPFYHPKYGIIYSLVETILDQNHSDQVAKFRSVISSKLIEQKINHQLLATGPFGQKGLKVFYSHGKYIVIARKREDRGDVILSSTHLSKVDSLDDLTPNYISRIIDEPDTCIKGFFAPNEWGNIGDSILQLADGRLAIMGHIAKMGNILPDKIYEREKLYSIFVGILNPDNLELTDIKMILTAQDVFMTNPYMLAKKEDLHNVVYPRSMGFCCQYENGCQNIYLIGSCGVSDRYSAIFKVNWPFSFLPDFSCLSNSPFNYPSSLMEEIFG